MNANYKKNAAPVTLFKGCVNGIHLGYLTIGQIFRSIRDDNNQRLIELTEDLQTFNREDAAKYKALKEKECPAFIIGEFTARKDKACKKYVPLLAFDVDSCHSEKEAFQLIESLSSNQYVYAAYLSPSGEGLRFLVWCNSLPETHKAFYQKVADYFSKFLSIPTDKALRRKLKQAGQDQSTISKELKRTTHIDTSTNNLGRLWFYTWVPENGFYHNEDSQVFYLKEAAQSAGVVADGRGGQPISEAKKVEICRDKVNRQDIPGGRNNFVFAFACEMARHGVLQSRALSECLSYQDKDFGESEIKKSVASAYQSKSQEFTEDQIKKYYAMVKGEGRQPPKQQKQKQKKTKEAIAPPPANDDDYMKLPKFVRIKLFIGRRYDLRLNVVANDIEISPKDANKYKVLNENDLICELYEAGFNGIETPLMALLKSSYVKEYDPFKEYFESLPDWKEGDPDYITELANYVNAVDQFWFNTQFKKMLIRTVACALKVIAFNKQCFVLKGQQNDGKTTFVRFLCPPKLQHYITEHINFNNKDGNIALSQNIIVNLDELSKLPKADINKVKSMITIDHVKERLPFDRKPTRIPRRASFFGSTNDDQFLTDSTGNVRWLIMEIKKNGIHHDKGGPNGYTAVNIDLVYSQAYSLLKSGFEFQLTKQEIEKSEKNNKGFQIVSVEQELIQELFLPSQEKAEKAEFLTTTNILKAIEVETKTTTSNRNVGRALKILGFEKTQLYNKEYRQQRGGYWVERIQS